jgi:hypothetical protein
MEPPEIELSLRATTLQTPRPARQHDPAACGYRRNADPEALLAHRIAKPGELLEAVGASSLMIAAKLPKSLRPVGREG